MTRKTIYKRVQLSRLKYESREFTAGGRVRVRTMPGKSLMRLVGECIAGGGAVDMETFYIDGDEYANATLVWGTD